MFLVLCDENKSVSFCLELISITKIMRPILPLQLRRCLLASFFLSFSSSGADYTIDASQASIPGRNVYQTLAELVSSGTLSAGDTVILNNDDFSLVSSLSVPVNFRSNDPETPRKVDLTGLGNTPLFKLSRGDYMIDMKSVVLTNTSGRVIYCLDQSSSSGTVSLKVSDDVAFKNNHSSGVNEYGGAISLYSYVASKLAVGDNTTFESNYATGSGGAISVHSYGSKEAVLTMGNNAVFTGNYAGSGKDGGAIHVYGAGGSTVSLGDNMKFVGNYVPNGYGGSGGAIYVVMPDSTKYGENSLSLGSNAVFTGNYVNGRYSYGGAIAMHSASRSEISTLVLGTGAVFTGNYIFSTAGAGYDSYGYGGAIYAASGRFVNLIVQDGAVFTGNYAWSRGGAIYLQSSKEGSTSQLLALSRDVIFSGNKIGGTFTQHSDGTFFVENGIANAIHIRGQQDMQLAASEGRQVRFDDPLVTSAASAGSYPNYTDLENITLSINQYSDTSGSVYQTDGTVIFSGELYQGDSSHLVASRYSDFKGQTTLYGGTLILEHNVVFGNSELRDDTSMVLKNGTLEITGGSTINAASFTVSHADIVLRPGTSAFINAKNVDMSQGFVFDMQRQFQSSASLELSHGMSISASNSFLVGGNIGILDNYVSSDYFYADNSWAQERVFVVLTDSDKTRDGDFSGTYSMATGSEYVESPYTYTGVWSYQWLDADGDGFPEQLQLVWTPDRVDPPDPVDPPGPVDPEEPVDPTPPVPPTPGIRDILPELAGGLAMNSMWSSASNVLGMSGAALEGLDTLRFTTGPENNYWIKGLGDFLYHASEGVRDGFDYNGGGYAVGADRRVAKNTILGLGFGDLYGRMYSRSFVGDIGQQTEIAMLYGGWNKNLDRNNTLIVTGSVGYGWTDNRMNSFHTGGWSHGKWTNRTLGATLNGKWSRRVSEAVSMDFILGLEYTDVTQESFTETGWDARRFEKGHLKNLSMPVGVGMTCRSELMGREWLNSVVVSYLPDVYRENPSASAERLLNGYHWEAKGATPSRNAVRVNVSSALQLNDRWRVYAGYEFEGRNKAVAHRFNAGVSFSY